jgi:hypothetical protein
VRSLLVIYDLVATDHRTGVHARARREIGARREWAQVTETAWIVMTDETPEQLRDAVLGELDAQDRVFVAELVGAPAWHNAICPGMWLKEHL